MARAARSSATVTTTSGRALWRQRFHWPAVVLGGAVLAACIAGPALSTPATEAASGPGGSTLPASAWPDLLHQNSSTPALSSAPSNLVPACANGQPGSEEAAFSTGSAGGGTRVVLASLLAPTPMVTGVSPSSGPLTGGTKVEITGSGFTGATVVLFGVVPASFTVVSDTEITATTVAGVGTVDVKVVTLGGPSAATDADHFTFVAPALPAPPSLPGLPSVPGVPSAPSNPVTGGGTGGSTGTGSGSAGGTGGSTGTTGTTTTTMPATTLTPPPGGGGVIPNNGFAFSDGYLGCSLIDSQTGTPAAGETPQQDRAVRLALSLIGTPYVWGGESTHGFDCSGLVQFVYSAAGIELPRVAQSQYDAGPAVAPGQTVVPGDLIFFGTGPTNVSHVGIFVGNGVMVDAPHSGADVRLDKINGFEPIVGVTSPGQ